MIKTKILVTFGISLEAIKMAPLALALRNNPEKSEIRICVTGQHGEMLDQIMNFYDLIADYDLKDMKPNQNFHGLTSVILNDMRPILEDFKPDYVFVHGDATTSMAESLATCYSGCKIAHIEGGLRIFDEWSPFQEKMNRNMISKLADIHFAPTELSKINLLSEEINTENIIVTGNTVIDALQLGLGIIQSRKSEVIDSLNFRLQKDKPIILLTIDREEYQGNGFLNICSALRAIALGEDVIIVYPVDLNPNVQKPVYELLSDLPNVHLIDPQPCESFIWLINRSTIIITDSDSIHEEALALGKPVLVMRNTTENPEAVDAGTVMLVGTDKDKIIENATALLHDFEMLNRYSSISNSYGDSHPCQRIFKFLFPEEFLEAPDLLVENQNKF